MTIIEMFQKESQAALDRYNESCKQLFEEYETRCQQIYGYLRPQVQLRRPHKLEYFATLLDENIAWAAKEYEGIIECYKYEQYMVWYDLKKYYDNIQEEINNLLDETGRRAFKNLESIIIAELQQSSFENQRLD